MSHIFSLGWWSKAFVPQMPLLEIVARGTAVYLVLFILLRVVLKREAGTVGVTDLLVIVLLADAAQNAMAGTYTTIGDGLLLVLVIVFWAVALNWLAFRFPRLRPLIQPPALKLVNEGRVLRKNMARELVTEEELVSAVRLEGLESVEQVKAAYIEGDGRISIIPRDGKQRHHAPERRST